MKNFALPSNPTTISSIPVAKSFKRRLFEKLLPFYKSEGTDLCLSNIFANSLFGFSAMVTSLYGGGEIFFGEECLFHGHLILEKPEATIILGKRNFIGQGTQINSQEKIEIGDDALIAGNCFIIDHNSHSTNYLDRRNDIVLATKRFKGERLEKDFSNIDRKSIKIGNDCWIGSGSIILKGVNLGNRVIVAADRWLPKVFPTMLLWVETQQKF